MVHAVDGVSFEVHENCVTGLVGESGSGKSTLAKLLVGLLERTEGEITYRGKPLPRRYSSADFRQMGHEVQMIFQDSYASLNPRFTVNELIAEPLRLLSKMPPEDEKARVMYWLGRVGLSADHLNRYPHEFSGGQRQRVGIARAMITEPTLLVCDEPISALDVSVQAQVVNLLTELQQSMALTLIFIAHDLAMVRYISDRMAVMYLGVLVEEGPAEQVYSTPLHPYTRLLISSSPDPDPAAVARRKVPVMEGRATSPINVPSGCRFADRCADVMSQCWQETPQMRTLNSGTRVACHLYASSTN
jgi:oligopeptide/dipeptide ABC transporter ATP-binding protein